MKDLSFVRLDEAGKRRRDADRRLHSTLDAIPDLRRYRRGLEPHDRFVPRWNESDAERLVVISRATKGQRP
jgi:hypothetical protein